MKSLSHRIASILQFATAPSLSRQTASDQLRMSNKLNSIVCAKAAHFEGSLDGSVNARFRRQSSEVSASLFGVSSECPATNGVVQLSQLIWLDNRASLNENCSDRSPLKRFILQNDDPAFRN